jgi:hypothetical protein
MKAMRVVASKPAPGYPSAAITSSALVTADTFCSA